MKAKNKDGIKKKKKKRVGVDKQTEFDASDRTGKTGNALDRSQSSLFAGKKLKLSFLFSFFFYAPQTPRNLQVC